MLCFLFRGAPWQRTVSACLIKLMETRQIMFLKMFEAPGRNSSIVLIRMMAQHQHFPFLVVEAH